MEKFEWDLTEDERLELDARLRKRLGLHKLIAAIRDMLGNEADAEIVWWASVRKRLGLEDTQHLIANAGLGKVWIEGQAQPPIKEDK